MTTRLTYAEAKAYAVPGWPTEWWPTLTWAEDRAQGRRQSRPRWAMNLCRTPDGTLLLFHPPTYRPGNEYDARMFGENLDAETTRMLLSAIKEGRPIYEGNGRTLWERSAYGIGDSVCLIEYSPKFGLLNVGCVTCDKTHQHMIEEYVRYRPGVTLS